MADSIFTPKGEGLYAPTDHARGPWDRHALHGGAPAALIARAIERTEPGEQLPVAQLRVQFLKPIPFAELRVATEIVRDGRRVQELTAEVTAGGNPVCRASALRIQPLPGDLPRSGPDPAPGIPGPEQGAVRLFSLNGDTTAAFATTGMQMSWLDEPATPGPARVWMRLRRPLLPGEEPTPLVHLAATADFGNGVSAELPFAEYLFINADLTIHLWRPPHGEWIGLDSRTLLRTGGMGTSESVLHDDGGPVGRAFQSLVVQPR